MVSLSRRLNDGAVRKSHGLRKRAIQKTHDGGPFSVCRAKTHRMLGDAVVRSKGPHETQLLDVIWNPFGGVTIREIHHDVLCMALVKVRPLLAGVDMEVEVVEVGQVLRKRYRHTRHLRRGSVDFARWPAPLIGSSHKARG